MLGGPLAGRPPESSSPLDKIRAPPLLSVFLALAHSSPIKSSCWYIWNFFPVFVRDVSPALIRHVSPVFIRGVTSVFIESSLRCSLDASPRFSLKTPALPSYGEHGFLQLGLIISVACPDERYDSDVRLRSAKRSWAASLIGDDDILHTYGTAAASRAARRRRANQL